MKRWFISRVVTVTEDGEQYRRAKITTYDYPCSVVVATHQWAFGRVAIPTETVFAGDADVFLLPDATLDVAWSSLPSAVRNAVITRLQQAGFTTSGISNAHPVRRVLNTICGQVMPGATVETIDLTDPWA